MTARDELRATLADRYTIERELGGGGMSLVFLARETALGRAVVVKMLTPELAAGVSAERFVREIATAARLQQANIVPLLSTGEANGVPWYSMPYVSGESLRAKLALGQPIPLAEALNILRDVARALAFAHGEGVVHRDIKPENILLSGGAAVVTDFGIAKAVTASRTEDGSGVSAITQTGVAIGTPAYMPPEQIAGDPSTDQRADVYAWGVVAWEMMAGKHPFASRTSSGAMLAAHVAERPAALTTVRADVAPALAELIARCLEKDPAHRPQSAAELLTTLDQIGTATAPQSSTRAPHISARRVALIAAVLVAVFAAAAWFASRATGRAERGNGAQKSLAVLPFESVGGDTANAYFAEGIADELTTALAKVNGLHVAATSSAFSYRDKTADPREVGKALNVGAVLQGRVRREGPRMRVSVQLTNATDGLLLWSNSYEREVKDVFAVQDELTRDIVGALKVTFAGTAPAPVAPLVSTTTDTATYDLYLRGLFFLNQRGGGVARSIGYFERALARDSAFGRAWAELGMAYCVLPLFSPVPVDSLVGLARRAIANARRLDPTNASGYAAEGFADLLSSRWPEAAAALAHALELDSTHVVANRAYWSALYQTGRLDDAVAQARNSTRVDPLSPITYAVAAITMLNAGKRSDAVTMARRAIELDTTASGFPRLAYALTIYASGKVDSARKLLVGAGRVPQSSPWLGYLIAATGDRAGAATYIRQVEGERGHNSLANLAEAWTYLGGGDTTHAIDALERAVRAHEPMAFSVPFGMPAYDALRHSARFAAVIRGYGLDPSTYRVSER